jgi:hypothetical protein
LLTISNVAGAAYYYEASTAVEGAGQGQQAGTVSSWVDGRNARVEFTGGGAGPMVPAGSYLISHDGGETLYIVDPKKRTVTEIDLAQMFQMVGSLADATQGLVKIEFSDFSSEKLGEEPGQSILGYPTTHYRFKTGYTMKLGVLGMTRASRSETELELDCTPKLDAAGFNAWLRPDRFRTGNEGIDKMISQQYADLDCLPLRSRSVTKTTDPKGRSTTMTSTVEVTALREDTPPSDAFVVPADYERTSLADLSGPADTGGAADTSGAAEQQNAPEAPKKRPRLKDLLRR